MEFQTEYTRNEEDALDKEFNRLNGKCYLDHAGSTLYASSQIHAVQQFLTENLLCNPHTSRTIEDLIDQIRYRILRHFNTRSSEYSVIFTSGATASLKLVAENFCFRTSGAFVYHHDSHTSVLGMRDVVGTTRVYPIGREQLLANLLEQNETTGQNTSLLVFPAQCNFNGVKYPLELLATIKRYGLNGYDQERFHVCLDAACFVSTSFLDLNKYQPDFVCLSFYKLFGFPTGLGALLVHRDASKLLQKRYYGGGTVKIAMAGRNFHVKRDSVVERFEDGTIPFTSIASLIQGFDTLERLVPSVNGQRFIERIARQTFQLGCYCYSRLRSLQHANGNAVVKLYHDTAFETMEQQGGIVNFNILHDDGSYVGFAEFAYMANVHNIILRTGCFCNPGACQRLIGLTDEDVLKHFDAGHVCGDAIDLIDNQPTGSVRVSFGYMTKRQDVDRLIEMIEKCYIKTRIPNSISRRQIELSYKKHNQANLKMICLFPIKSCGSFKVTTSWPLCRKGLKYDRDFVIVDENGVVLTQKKLTEMCLIMTRINLDTNELTLSHPSLSDFILDMNTLANSSGSQSITLCETKVCQDGVQTVDCGDDVADWISVALQTSGLRLLKQSDDDVRTFRQTTKEIALANQAQFLLINQSSVQWLAEKVPDWDDFECEPTLDSLVDRFRGNLIIETGSRPMEEIQWKRVKIGEHEFAVDGPCSRCQMICIDQTSGVKTTEPLRTIAREFKGKMRFGIYLSRDELCSKDGSDNNILYCGSTVCGALE
ncbi:molybdenum cofactor sulfurase 3-like [Malaya genurostris]|uniref:molybdenum cofactor sulfurase 3-like n=1 Tax=Malaya genurostris TaxID=325434 RepID=UPI0026F3B9FE|nr:molybdenum cofactor sulfurase 3-like [Malaya genurostris]XP_058443495.1 molybdenum cofactor sulfurase 3-like [Malaya genurostris]